MKRILIVEDEAIVQLEMKQYLERLGHRAFGALTSSAALRIARQNHVDVACVDIMLREDAEGIDLARRLRAEFGVPIVFVTGNSDRRTREEAMTVDPAAYIVKPVHLPALETVIRNLD